MALRQFGDVYLDPSEIVAFSSVKTGNIITVAFRGGAKMDISCSGATDAAAIWNALRKELGS